jgi:hypothetical protein
MLTSNTDASVRQEPNTPKKLHSDYEPKRVHVSLPASLHDRMLALQQRTHASSTSDLFRSALVVYAALSKAHEKGEHIIIRDDAGNERELAIFLNE